MHVILYEIYRHRKVLFSSGLLLQENSKVQVHWKTYIKYLTMLPAALGMQHWPKTGSKLSSIAFLSIIFGGSGSQFILSFQLQSPEYFLLTSMETFFLFLKHAEKLSFYRMLKTRTSCSIFKFYCMKFHSSCPEYFVKSKKPQHAAGSEVYKKIFLFHESDTFCESVKVSDILYWQREWHGVRASSQKIAAIKRR